MYLAVDLVVVGMADVLLHWLSTHKHTQSPKPFLRPIFHTTLKNKVWRRHIQLNLKQVFALLRPDCAVLLAAGRGRRLRPHTDHTPKPLLPVNGRPTLDFILTALSLAGIRRVCLVTHHLAEQISDYVADGAQWNMQASYCHQTRLLGSAHALQTILKQNPAFIQTGQPFIVSATDYLLPPAYMGELLDTHIRSSVDISVSLKQVPNAELAGRSSVRCDEHFKLSEIIEKPGPGQAPGPLAASLTYVLPAAAIDFLPDLPASPRGEYELPDLVNRMIKAGYSAQGVLQETPPEWEPPMEKKPDRSV